MILALVCMHPDPPEQSRTTQNAALSIYASCKHYFDGNKSNTKVGNSPF